VNFKTYLGFSLIFISFITFGSGTTNYAPPKKKTSAIRKLQLDTTKSKVTWVGTKVTGSHKGNVNVTSGNLTFDGDKLTGGTIYVDMSSISVTDISNPKWNKKLKDHLNSDDFFSTKKHKTAVLKINNASLGKGGKFDIQGDLTIKGVTKPVSFSAALGTTASQVKGKASITFNRIDYGIKYKSGSFFEGLGDKLIHDKVTLNVDIMTKP
jgi:polyisoprenoid-binding protein YceI